MTLYGGLEVLIRHSKKFSGLNILYSQYEQNQPLEIQKSVLKDNEVIGCDVLINTGAITMEKIGIDFIEKLYKVLKLSDYEEVIVDTSMELAARNTKFIQLADRVLYVLSQDITTCWKTMKHLEILDKLSIDRNKVKLIMNRYRKDIIFNKAEFEEESKMKVLASIPDFKSTVTSLNNEGRIVLSHALSKPSKILKKEIGKVLVNEY